MVKRPKLLHKPVSNFIHCVSNHLGSGVNARMHKPVLAFARWNFQNYQIYCCFTPTNHSDLPTMVLFCLDRIGNK